MFKTKEKTKEEKQYQIKFCEVIPIHSANVIFTVGNVKITAEFNEKLRYSCDHVYSDSIETIVSHRLNSKYIKLNNEYVNVDLIKGWRVEDKKIHEKLYRYTYNDANFNYWNTFTLITNKDLILSSFIVTEYELNEIKENYGRIYD